MEYTKYAAVGHFKCHRTLDGKKYPVVIVGRKEYMLDVQEMTVWSSLAWGGSCHAARSRKPI